MVLEVLEMSLEKKNLNKKFQIKFLTLSELKDAGLAHFHHMINEPIELDLFVQWQDVFVTQFCQQVALFVAFQ